MDVIEPTGMYFTFMPFLSLVIGVVVSAGLFALVVWVLYTVIWRGVRRGLQEYYGPASSRAGALAGESD